MEFYIFQNVFILQVILDSSIQPSVGRYIIKSRW